MIGRTSHLRPRLPFRVWKPPVMIVVIMARAGVTVTRLLCDPLPYKNVLKYRTGKTGTKYRFSFQYNFKMCQAFSQIFLPAVLRIGLLAFTGSLEHLLPGHWLIGVVMPRAVTVACWA
jgi:hypothetical protein